MFITSESRYSISALQWLESQVAIEHCSTHPWWCGQNLYN